MERQSLPLDEPASLNDAKLRIMPNTSCDSTVCTFACEASGRRRVRREPWVTTISCCFFPLKAPRTAWVMAEGGRMERE